MNAQEHIDRAETILEEIRSNSDLVKEMFQIVHSQSDYNSHIVGRGSHNTYFWAGNFQSEEFGKIHIGTKVPKDKDLGDAWVDYINSVIYAQILIEEFGDLIIEELPIFYGLLVDKNNKEVAVASQDFSDGNKYHPSAYVPSLNKLLKKVFNDDEYWLEKIGILINGQRRLVDLGDLFVLKEPYNKRQEDLFLKYQENPKRIIRDPV